MPTVSVETETDAVLLIATIESLLHDWRPMWKRMEAKLPAEQKRHWDEDIGRRFNLKASTVVSRARRKPKSSYYARNRPGPRAQPSKPYLEWTGSLREATERFSEKKALSAKLDMDKTYKGPIKGVPSKMLTARGLEGWDERKLEKLVEETLVEFLEQDVIKKALRR